MKLKVGMYVRFKNNKNIQYIGKIVNINEYREPYFKYAIEVTWYDDYIFIGNEDILKASFNIIDLIKVGDYVNDAFVLDFETLQTGEKAVIVDGLITYGWGQGVIPASEIKKVVTKEQFNSMKYVVERNNEDED